MHTYVFPLRQKSERFTTKFKLDRVVVKLITKISPITAQMMLDKENATHDMDAESILS
jgi:hypothetical protein